MPRGVLFWFLPFVFLSSFSVYLLTLNSTFQPDDSAETIAACVTLAPQHPTGYPLYSFIGRSFSFLPVANPAFRLNLLAACLGSLVVTLVAAYLLRVMDGSFSRKGFGMTASLLAASSGALLLAFSKTYWAQCLTAKGGIYILQALVLLGLIHGLEKAEKPTSLVRSYLALGILVSLGFANGLEMQILFTVSILFYWSLYGRLQGIKNGSNGRKMMSMATMAVIGLSLYLFLPLRNFERPPSLLWGQPRTFYGFLGFLSNSDVRQEMGSKIGECISCFSSRGTDWLEAWRQVPLLLPQWVRISDHLSSGLGLFTLIPLVAGVLWASRRKKYPLLLVGLAVTLSLIFVNGVLFLWPEQSLWSVDKFFLPVDLFGAICAGLGLRWMIDGMGRIEILKKARNRWKVLVAGVVLGTFFPLCSATANFKLNDQRSRMGAYDYGADLLKSLERGAVFVAEGDDPLFSVYFFQEVLGFRKDVTLVPAYYLWNAWGMRETGRKIPGSGLDKASFISLSSGQRVFYSLCRILDQVRGKRSLQVSANLNVLDRCYFALQPSVLRTGDLYSVLAPAGFSLFYGEGLGVRGFDPLDGPRERGPAQDSFFLKGPGGNLSNLRAQAYFNAAEYCSTKGFVDRADRYFMAALERAGAPKLLAHIWVGRGDFLSGQRKADAALEAYRNSVDLYPEPAFYSRLVRSLLLRGNTSEALAEAQRATEIFPNDGQTWRALAACEEVLGDEQKARLDFERALEVEKNKRGEAS